MPAVKSPGLRGSRLAWFGLVAVSAALAIDLLQRTGPIGIDFHTYLAAAQVGLQQGWPHVYEQSLVVAAQKSLAPALATQPFLSPPTVAWLVAPLTALPYDAAYVTWAGLTFVALAGALAWSGESLGVNRWVAVVGALAPWWVMHAVNLGQVVPLVAAGVLVSWRLIREKHDVAAGLFLSVILLKPNLALLVPFALLAAGRQRALAAWLAAAAAVVVVAALTLSGEGMSGYASQLLGGLPPGADNITLHGAFGIAGSVALLVRVVVIGAALAASFRLRGSPGLVIPVAIVASLIAAPYLHASDLILLSAAAWMVWEERPSAAWRAPLALGWVLGSSYLFAVGHTLDLTRWPLLEIALWLAIVLAAWRPLTGSADLKSRAPA